MIQNSQISLHMQLRRELALVEFSCFSTASRIVFMIKKI